MIPGALGRFQPLLTEITAELHVLDVTLDMSLRVLLSVRLLPALRAAPFSVQLPNHLADLPLDLSEGGSQYADILQVETFRRHPGTFLSLCFPSIFLD